LTDENIKQMLLNNQAALQAFPFLAAARQQLQTVNGCAGCRRTEETATLATKLQEVRRQLAMMPAASKDQLLRILNAKSFRVFYFDYNPQGIKVRMPVDYPPKR